MKWLIPANKIHLGYHLDPMAIGRASKTIINANMGASPVSSSLDEEVEKLPAKSLRIIRRLQIIPNASETQLSVSFLHSESTGKSRVDLAQNGLIKG